MTTPRTPQTQQPEGSDTRVTQWMAIKRWWPHSRGWQFFTLLIIVILLAVLGRGLQVWLDSQYNGERGPYLQRPGPRNVSIHWQSETPRRSRIQYHLLALEAQPETAATPQTAIVSAQPQTRHHIRLTDLQPAARYEYTLYYDDDIAYGPYQFHTWPRADTHRDASPAVRVWALGDPGWNSELAQQVRHSALNWLNTHRRRQRPLMDVWLTTGDNAYRSGRNREYQAAIFEPYREALAQFALFPAYGNHDARRWAFFDIFDLPAQGESGGVASGSEHYYALDYGPLHVVVLDSQDSAIGDNSAMVQWLTRDLRDNTAPWTLAVFHHPPYSHGSHDSDDDDGSDWRMRAMREVAIPVLERYGVDVVLAGHSHAYERSHLINGHYGLSDTFDLNHIIDGGAMSSQHGIRYQYRRLTNCDYNCGTVYIVLGNSAELHAGTMDHPAMPIAMVRGGSLVLDVEAQCFYGRMIDNESNVADAFSIARDDAVCNAE